MNPVTTTLTRERIRNDLAVRRITVARTEAVSPVLTRVTFTGPDLEGFTAPGPADHVKLFFPDADGVLTTPSVTPEGIRRPSEGTVIARDYTPLTYRPEAGELDIDFVIHGDDGPASAWAARAEAGMTIGMAGPRGSHLAPEGVEAVVVVADETALPAAARWLDAFPADVPLTALLAVADEATTAYLSEDRGRDVRWFTGSDRFRQVEQALRGLTLGPASFVFLAGEATAIAPLRRYLRRELGLAKEQVDAHGYWKQGVTNLDHHAPLDPSDPD